MKLETRHNKNTLIGQDNEAPDATQFSIKAGPEIMRILSSSLYTDKIGAVVRELIANARDAYNMVHPTKRNPEGEFHWEGIAFQIKIDSEAYTIRDYGIGLSYADTLRLMTTYGASTKSKDNNSVGCFGVGSKSGFAYTQEFTMTSFFNGEQHTFHAILGSSGIPEMIHLGTIPTDEPNGIMFRIPFVDSGDRYAFEKKARDLCQSIGVPSQLISNREETKYTGKEFFKELKAPYNVGTYVEANIYLSHIEDISKLWIPTFMVGGIKYAYNQYSLPFPMVLDLPIGSVDIAVSREALEDTKRNREYIKSLVDEVVRDITKEVKGNLSCAQSKYDMAVILDKAPYPIARDIKATLGDGWSSVDLTTTFEFTDDATGAITKSTSTQSISFLDMVRNPSIKYVLQDGPKKITQNMIRHVFNGALKHDRILRQYSTREEWMMSPLGPEIKAIPNQFIFSSDIVVPKMIKPTKPKLQKEEIKIGRVSKRRNYIREEVVLVSDLPDDTIFYTSDSFPRAKMLETLNEGIYALAMGKRQLPSDMDIEEVVFISTKDTDKIAQSRLFDTVYQTKLLEEFKDDAGIINFATHYSKRTFLEERYSTEAAGYLKAYSNEVSNYKSKLDTLKENLKNFLTTAKSLGILTERLHRMAEMANKSKVADIEKTKPIFDKPKFISLMQA